MAGARGVAPADEPPAEADRPRGAVLAAALVCALLGAWWAGGVSRDHSLGWDESMHAQYPAVRMLLFAQDGRWSMAAHALHDCAQYPFAWPVALAAVQSVTGVSEVAARRTARALWAVGVFGVFLLARELVARVAAARGRPGRGDGIAPWLAAAFAAASPLALSFSGTLFLEIPVTVVTVLALRSWLRRGRGRVIARELAAGAWLALAFFTKFNFGLLLGFGLFLALCVEGVAEARAGRGAAFARRVAALAAVPLAGFAWWFLAPFPEGPETARLHRDALVAFLTGNLDESLRTQWQLRPLHAATFLVWSPRVLALFLAGAALSLAHARRRPVWTLWLAWIGCAVPVLWHPYHHDRFLLPSAPFLWVLAGLGIARVLPVRPAPRVAAVALLVLAVALRADLDSRWVLRRLGLADPRPEIARYQTELLAAMRDLRPGRRLETNGLARRESDALLDLLEAEVRPADRVAWVGMTQNVSPAAVHLGLLERGAGAPREIERGRLGESFVEIGYVDPGWSRERILRWASRFTLVLATDPIDMVGNPDRAYLARYRDALRSSDEWSVRALGTVAIHRVSRDLLVRVEALRPASATLGPATPR